MAQQPQQNSGQDNSFAAIWVTVLIFIVGGVIWYSAHQQIVSFLFKVHVWQAQLVDYFVPGEPLSQEVYLMETLDPGAVDLTQVSLLLRLVGDYVRYPVIALLVILSIILYHSDITLRFRRVHTMKTLRAQEQYNWPAISPVVKLDLVNEDINVGPWAMALSPMEFARKYNLLRKPDPLLENLSAEEMVTASIQRSDAKRVLTLQLGPYFQGLERSPGHVRALAAVFLARINRDRTAASMILTAMDKGSVDNKMNYAIANATLQKYQNDSKLQEISQKHAYLLTFMADLLAAARVDGVVPSAEFLWVKPIDRRLWYMLNCVGRQTPFSEVAGPFAHWKAEQAMGRALKIPMVDEAIKALEIAVKEIKLSPQELQNLKT